jgi:hypothetical protein
MGPPRERKGRSITDLREMGDIPEKKDAGVRIDR